MFKSMVEAFKNLFKPVRTINYPAQEIILPSGYRGLIEYDKEACIFCDKCEKVCPPGAILFYQHEEGEKEYRYNPWLCIYCGECVRACPKPQEAIWQSETKQQSAVKEDGANEGWFVWEEACKKSREAYAAAKKERKPKMKSEEPLCVS
ncbi:MAG: 4Fe-4S dicluster domain-containing protein [Campylobacterales bacterium]|nr:4Fe-4S dicluster domain-containing protein [Campylobacterales bacterium]